MPQGLLHNLRPLRVVVVLQVCQKLEKELGSKRSETSMLQEAANIAAETKATAIHQLGSMRAQVCHLAPTPGGTCGIGVWPPPHYTS